MIKYLHIQDEDEEDADDNDYDEEIKGASSNTTRTDESSSQHIEEPA